MKNQLIICVFGVAICFFSAVGICKPQSSNRSTANAKVFFFDPVSGVAISPGTLPKTRTGRPLPRKPKTGETVRYPGIHYWLEMDGVGRVLNDRVFHTGDRLRLKIRSNTEGYLYLLAFDANGRAGQIYPEPGNRSDIKISPDYEYSPPGYIVFKTPVKDERLIIYFSQDNYPPPNVETLDYLAQHNSEKGSKDLVFERDTRTNSQYGMYTVNKNGGPVIVELLLKHQEH